MKSKLTTTLWGLLSILPLMIIAHSYYVRVIVSPTEGYYSYLGDVWSFFALIGPLIILLAFTWHAFFNPRLPRSKRNLWIALLFFGNAFTMPFYFWYYIDK